MNDPRINTFISRLDELEDERQRIADGMLKHLIETDPQLAQLAITVLEDSHIAAQWLSDTVPALGDRRPINLLAAGQRQIVIDCLNRMEHGIFS